MKKTEGGYGDTGKAVPGLDQKLPLSSDTRC